MKRNGNCENGCDKPIHARGICKNCYRKVNYEEHERERRGAIKHDLLPIGSIRPDTGGYQRIKIDTGHGAKDWVKYHKYLMEQHLGRKLESYENVHHKNGIRNDDRLDNYELWVTKQPKGQRPKDLIEYAIWIIKTYGNEKTI